MVAGLFAFLIVAAGCRPGQSDALRTDSTVVAEREILFSEALAAGETGPTKPLAERKPVARWVLPRVLGEISGMALTDDGRQVLSYPAEEALFDGKLKRLAKVMGKDFADNSAKVEARREGFALSGFAGLPTYSRANAQMQFLFVNNRPVRDKLLVGAVRAAYAGDDEWKLTAVFCMQFIRGFDQHVGAQILATSAARCSSPGPRSRGRVGRAPGRGAGAPP